MSSMTVDQRNAETSRAEVAAFIAEEPARYFAYHDAPRELTRGTLITTWMGDPLGRVIETGAAWTSNMGDRRQSFRMLGANMATYSGIAYLSAGTYVRMRKVA